MSSYVFGRRPEDAGTAAEYAHLVAVQEHAEREARRIEARRKQWTAENAERERERTRLAEERRQTAEAGLQAELRQQFLRSNPSASDSDFTRMWPSLRDEHFATEFRQKREREVEALRARSELL
jgi:hypothetical protein